MTEKDRKVMIIYDQHNTVTNNSSEKEISGLQGLNNCPIFYLRHPKTGQSALYVLVSDIIHEIHWHKEAFSSWFIGNSVLEDGSLYFCTPVDPVFLVIPLMAGSHSTRGKTMESRYRSIEDILTVEGYPKFLCLEPMVRQHLGVVCSCKEVGNEKYYKLEDEKMLLWLSRKVEVTRNALKISGGDIIAAMDENDITSYAIGMIGEYIANDSWLEKLRTKFGVISTANVSENEHFSIKQEQALMAKSAAQSEAPQAGKKSKSSKLKPQVVGARKITSFFAVPK